jgi:hypothetical protein
MGYVRDRRLADQAFIQAIANLDDRTLRLMIFGETILRARLDLRVYVADAFGMTQEFRILQALLTFGPMNKRQLSSKLFPHSADPHSKLSRGPSEKAFYSLLTKGVIGTIATSGRGMTYDIAPAYKPVLDLLVTRCVSVPNNNPG